MPRKPPGRLVPVTLPKLKPGRHSDGGNLWLTVNSAGSRTWTVRFTSPLTGRPRELGLGSFPDVSLSAARERARDARVQLSEGRDPVEERLHARAERVRARAQSFRVVAERYVASQAAGWNDERLPKTWLTGFEKTAFPVFGDVPVAQVTRSHVLAAVGLIWTTTPHTARRVLDRISRVLDAARAEGLRSGDTPRWKNDLEYALAMPVGLTRHRAALPWGDVGPVYRELSAAQGMGARCVQWICLTLVRSAEARGARWGEIDFRAREWRIPPERMKGRRRGHDVPLCDAALALLDRLPHGGADALIFPNPSGRQLSDVALSKALHIAAGTKDTTVHGLRSSFTDWARSQTEAPHEVVELSLAHQIGTTVERAYRRDTLSERRRALLEEWAATFRRKRRMAA